MMQAKLILLVGPLLSSAALAQEARYEIRGRCYSAALNDNRFRVADYGWFVGRSNLDGREQGCREAFEHLASSCDRWSRRLGQDGGSVYRDLRITTRDYSESDREDDRLLIESWKERERIRGRSGRGKRQSSGTRLEQDSHQERIEAGHTVVQYVDVDPEQDCRFDPRIPAEDEPSLQNPDFGG